MTFKYRPFDKRLEHRAAGAADIGSDTVIDTITQRTNSRTEAITKVHIESVEIASGDELYTFVIELSDDNFVTVNEVAAIRDAGATGARQSGAPDSAAGDEFELYWTNEVNGVAYRYWRLKVFVGGTVATGISFLAHTTILQ